MANRRSEGLIGACLMAAPAASAACMLVGLSIIVNAVSPVVIWQALPNGMAASPWTGLAFLAVGAGSWSSRQVGGGFRRAAALFVMTILIARLALIILAPGILDRAWPHPDRFSPELVSVRQIAERPQTTILLILFVAVMTLMDMRRTAAAQIVAAVALLLPLASLIARLFGDFGSYGLMPMPTTLAGTFAALALLMGTAHRGPLRSFLTQQPHGRRARRHLALLVTPFVAIAVVIAVWGTEATVRWLPVLAAILVLSIGFVFVVNQLRLARLERRHPRLGQAASPLLAAMDGAWSRGEFFLLYQPQIDLTTRRVIGAEALVRWMHPTEGLVTPDQFIPIAEQSGLIEPLGTWILAKACAEAASWRLDDRSALDGRISVNVSPMQLRQPCFVASVVETLRATGLPPDRLTLEITESVLVLERDPAIAVMTELRAIGVRIAMDDFGTGYSSLSYLRRLPIDELKIDRSFVSELPGDEGAVAIVRALLAMGRSLRMHIIAEGIETPEQAEFLSGIGCDSGQGYYYARPLPPDGLIAFARKVEAWQGAQAAAAATAHAAEPAAALSG